MTTMANLWHGLETFYMTKSIGNNIRLKEHLYTFLNHLDGFHSIIIDLESLDVKLEEEDNATFLAISLPTSYEHFREILLYNNSDNLSFEDVKAKWLSKESLTLRYLLK